jgi:type I restriction enzyme S subunit
MNAAQVLDHFDRICDAADAIPRVRRFILELAVRGKLVEQDANDEPALDLLKRIESEREQLLNHGRGLPKKPVPTINAEEADFKIPQSWVWVRLGKVIKLWNGFAFRSSDFQTQGVPVIRIGDLQGGEVVLSSAVYVSEQFANSVAPEVWIPTDALLIAMSGATTGKVAFNRTGRRLLLNQRVGRVQSFLISQAFLKFFFDTIVTQNLNISFGTAIPNLSTQQINQICFPLPPLAEQHRIVAKVDELMALCDQLEAAQAERERRRDHLRAASLYRLNNGADADEFREHARFHLSHLQYLTTRPEHIQQLRQVILNLAVCGKLVPQDSTDEPASELLKKRIKLPDGHLRRRKIFKKGSIDSPERLFPELPSSWEYTDIQTLYDLNMVIDYGDGNHGSLYPRSSEFGEEGVTFVTAKDLIKGRVSWEGCAKLSDERALQLTKGWAKGGDVLLTHNATVGRVARVEPDARQFLVGTSVTFYRLNPDVLSADFFYHMLQSRLWQGQLEAIMEQTTRNQVSIQKQAFFRVVVPPLAEQHRIVAKVDELMALCDRLEVQLLTTYTETRRLLEAVLHEALAVAASPYDVSPTA